MGYEQEANKYNYKCMMLTVLGIELIWIAEELGIFVVEQSLMRKAVIPVTLISMIVILILASTNLDKDWIKYVLITTEVVSIYIMGTMLTYHVAIFYGIPFLMAAHYQTKKMSIYTLIISLVGMIVSLTVGYKYGLCDLNMVAFTKDTIDTYGQVAVIPIYVIDGSALFKLIVYFYLPRAVILVLFTFMSLAIASAGRKMQKRQTEAEYASTHDQMTGMLNKNMYLKMIKTKYPKIKELAVAYFDVNGLKRINDTLGHEMGDFLIEMAAKTLLYFKSDKISVYRMGGDEFVLVMQDGTQDKMEKLISSWKKLLDAMNGEMIDFKCEMAYGYSIGTGKDIETLVEKADKLMYEKKMAMKGIATREDNDRDKLESNMKEDSNKEVGEKKIETVKDTVEENIEKEVKGEIVEENNKVEVQGN